MNASQLNTTRVRRESVAGGAWISGTYAGYRFEALSFADHADMPEWEIEASRISKLWVRREADRKVVAHFDRGWDRLPSEETDAAFVMELVDTLSTM